MKNRILSLLMALGLVLAFAVNASAAEVPAVMPDLDQKGSLTLIMDVDGVLLDSGSLNMYYVATIVREGDRYDFRLLDALTAAGAKLDTDNLYDSEQAKSLLGISKSVLGTYLTAPIVDGKAVFTDLEPGLYLVWQDESDASDGYGAIQPFLISVPRWQNGDYTMDVVADPKVPIEPDTPPESPPPPPPTETPPVPPTPPPHLPQTGQLNWPIPVMAVTGAALFALGVILCRIGKRMENEK